MRIVPIEFHLFWDLIRTSHKNSLLATLKGVGNLGNIPFYPSMGLPEKKKNLSSSLMQPDLNLKKKVLQVHFILPQSNNKKSTTISSFLKILIRNMNCSFKKDKLQDKIQYILTG